MPPVRHSLTVRGRRLARELRATREHTGLTLEQASAALGWNRFKLGRIEAGKTRVSSPDVARILDVYGIDPSVHASIVQLARDASRRGWWSSYSGIFVGGFVGLEDEASEIRTYQVQLIPGLLQTEEYARAVISAGVPGDPDEVEKRLRARMARKTLLSRPDAPTLKAVLAEPALRQRVGGGAVMRDQLAELIKAAGRPNVTVRILPQVVGARAGIEGPFVILNFEDELDPDIGYAEGMYGNIFIEGIEQVARCTVEFDRIWEAALGEEASERLIADIASKF